jgi:hypothetical protein
MAAPNVMAARNGIAVRNRMGAPDLQLMRSVRPVRGPEVVVPGGEYRDDSDRHVGAGY